MKKYIKLGIPFILFFICIILYVLVPNVWSISRQAARVTQSVAAQYQLTDKVDAFNIRQVITVDSTTSRTIMWQSDLAEKNAVIEYRQKNTDTILTMPASNEIFNDDKTTTYIHAAELSHLTAGSRYEYRVGYDKKRSEWLPLSLASGNTFKVLIFPDSQSSNYDVWRDTAQAAWSANRDAQFFINMGDLVDNGEDHTQWNLWFEAVENIISAIPIAPVMGNHETYDQNWKVRMPTAYLHMFNVPNAVPDLYQNQFYSFDYGNIHFVVLNTQITEMSQFQPHLLEDEINWFKTDMAHTNKKWKIVLMHKDPLQYAFQNRPQPRTEGFSAEGKEFMPLFDAYNIDVVLSAHLHTYRNRGHIRNFQRDNTGPLYILTGVAGNVRYPELWKQHSLDEVIAPQPETDNYLTMEAGEHTLTFSSYLPNGQKIDAISINK
ncbi:MAG: metallophosphoesterase family protein [Megasphaera sp.]|jgi:hypothetical protein|nr:metallophosphoesterase family protein [Megasphaera sp.]MCI1822690.1 metallophosphoesterase family protein [Megasphaera sp.]